MYFHFYLHFIDGETALSLLMGFLSFIGMIIMITYTVSVTCPCSNPLWFVYFSLEEFGLKQMLLLLRLSLFSKS